MKALAVAIAAVSILAGAALKPGAAQAGERPLLVVELFTSQGCSSCPPAEAYLGELAKRNDLLALEQHVDYWDYIGWKDPFALSATTDRQRRYNQRLGRGYVYTPQMVVDGIAEAVGSDRAAVERAVATARATPGPRVAVRVAATAKGLLRVDLPQSDSNVLCDVFLIGFDPLHMTKVLRGENGGRTLNNYNVVRDFQHVGFWSGQAATIDLPKLDIGTMRSWAVIVQVEDSGAILGAARINTETLTTGRSP
ncbi:MAG: DUF1223 domain-containing protein [Alphaproteobacteria bacterium]|nr:DUF1223 domain-containing protein [Alphaproteobacteria bacterium]